MNILASSDDDEKSKQITIKVEVPKSSTGGKAALLVYLHDACLADAPAALSASLVCEIAADETSQTVVVEPDLTVTQVGQTYDQMQQPSFYVALDIESSTYTYLNGPTFGIQLGDSVSIQLAAKK